MAEQQDNGGNGNGFSHQVERKALRHIRARREQHSVWFGLGMFGLIGWSIAVPTLGGIALGIWLDEHWPGEVSWTLTLLFAGLMLGCVNAWRWVKHEGNNHQGQGSGHEGEE